MDAPVVGLEGLAAVDRRHEVERAEVELVLVGGGNRDDREVPRADVDQARVDELLPLLAEVFRLEEDPLLRVDQRVDVVAVGRGERDRDTPERTVRHVFLELLPRRSAVGRASRGRFQARLPRTPTGSGGTATFPRRAPGSCPAAIARSEAPVSASTKSTFFHVSPPSVVRKIAALRVRLPDVAEHRDVDGVRIPRVDQDPRDLTRVGESHEPPARAGVGREVDAVPVDDVVAGVRFARPHPDEIRVGGRDGDGADRGRVLFEDRFERHAAVDRLPDATRRRADVDHVRVSRDSGDRGDAPAAGGRTEVAELEAALRSGRLVFASRLLGRGRDGGLLFGCRRLPGGFGGGCGGREREADEPRECVS